MMPVFDTVGPLNTLYALVSALPTVQKTYLGVPDSLLTTVGAYIAVAGSNLTDKASRLLQRRMRYLVVFGYRVKGAEANAELGIAQAVDDFIAFIYNDRTLGGTVQNLLLDLAIADTPQYQTWATGEFRLYPILVEFTQQANF